MKTGKIIRMIPALLLLVSCNQNNNNTQLSLFSVKEESVERFSATFTNFLNTDGSRYKRRKNYDYTPEGLDKVCCLYGISQTQIDILEYNGDIYADILISTLSGFNQIAYYKTSEKEILYYCTISGSGWLNARIGAFDFKAKKDMMVDFEFNRTNLMTNFHLAFDTSDESNLQVYKVDMDMGNKTYVRGELLFDNILQYDLVDWKAGD